MVCRLQEGLENLDTEDLVVRDDGGTRGNNKKSKKISHRKDVEEV